MLITSKQKATDIFFFSPNLKLSHSPACLEVCQTQVIVADSLDIVSSELIASLCSHLGSLCIFPQIVGIKIMTPSVPSSPDFSPECLASCMTSVLKILISFLNLTCAKIPVPPQHSLNVQQF